MQWTFQVVDADSVRAVLRSGPSVMQDALDDSIGTRPPRGAPAGGPSTYWIEQAIQGLRAGLSEPSGRPFIAGDITYLRVVGDTVLAGYDYAPDDEGEPVSAQEFLSLLTHWREATLRVDPAAAERLPTPPKAIPL